MYGEDGSAEARAQVSEQDAILALLTTGTRRWEDKAKRVRARRGHAALVQHSNFASAAADVLRSGCVATHCMMRTQ